MTGSKNHYPVRVPIFEGPLDLLLHLVRVNAVDITDIPILEITRQYEEYLDWMRELNLEVAADFLVMGAYTHSRLRRMIMGSATEHVLGAAELPVLMMP